MSHVLSVHSYRGGTGKSNVSANLACIAARGGLRVAVLDTDLQSPGAHLLFNLDRDRVAFTLTDFVFGRCDVEEAAYDMSASLGVEDGALYLLPSSMNIESISKVLAEGYDVKRLNEHFEVLQERLDLDVLFIDTHPGFNKETMLTTAVSDTLVLVVRPDKQDYHGTAVMVELSKRLRVPRVCMLANKVVRALDPNAIQAKLKEAFGYEVVGALPFEEDMAVMASEGLFVHKFPEHPFSKQVLAIARRLLPMLPGGDGGEGSPAAAAPEGA